MLRTLRNHVSRLNLGLRPKPIVAASQAATPAVFEYVPEGWSKQRNDPKVKGWAVESITAANAAAWPDFSRTVIGTAPLAISPEMPPGSAPTLAAQSAMIAFSYAVALAAVGSDQISILDWGGAAGQHALVARTMVPNVSIDYHCVDLESLRSEFLDLVEQSHMRLFCEFLGSDAITVKDAPEQCQFRSFLFQRR
jgi:hypothetical protein